MKCYIYLFVNLSAIFIPFIFSFHPKLNFLKKWKALAGSFAIAGVTFILWDILYTAKGIWGFNPEYLIGIYLFNLPFEKILFFFCIPYACMFTYHCLKLFYPITPSTYNQWISYKLCVALLIAGIYFTPNLYTSVTFMSLSVVLFLIQLLLNPNWLPRLYTSVLLLMIPFILANGILTGTGLADPIIWHNENEIIGIKILSIPIEDFYYSFLLILLHVFFFEIFSSKKSFH